MSTSFSKIVRKHCLQACDFFHAWGGGEGGDPFSTFVKISHKHFCLLGTYFVAHNYCRQFILINYVVLKSKYVHHTILKGIKVHFKLIRVFNCDEQLKKWRCHSVCVSVRPSVPFFSFSVLEVSASPKEFQWCFKTAQRKFQWCFKEVFRVFTENFKGVSRKF